VVPREPRIFSTSAAFSAQAAISGMDAYHALRRHAVAPLRPVQRDVRQLLRFLRRRRFISLFAPVTVARIFIMTTPTHSVIDFSKLMEQ
jgi:hypothetical protein